MRFFAADFRSDARGDDVTVAAHHRDAADARIFQICQRFFRFGARLILHPDPADALAVARDKNQTPAFRLVQVHGFLKARVNAVVLEPLRAANENFRAVDLRLHAATGGFGKIFRLGERNSGFARECGKRFRRRMVAVFFGGRGEQQKFGGLRVADRREAADGELAGRERAGLVEDERVDLRGEFDVRDVLDQNSQTCGGGERGDHRRRRGENERARAGHDEHRDDAVQIVRERPDQRADDQHERRVKAHVLIHDFLDRQFGFFRRDDEFAHAAERCVRAGAADFDFQNAGQILRAGKNFVARIFFSGQRFAGDCGLIERAFAFYNCSIRRHVVAGANPNYIANF